MPEEAPASRKSPESSAEETPVRLVSVYKPTSRDDWTRALAKVKTELGIGSISVPYAGDVFLKAIEAYAENCLAWG